MHAVILAAGVGQRLAETAANRPKSLLEFGGLSLLARHLIILRHYGVYNITVITGYQSSQVEAELSQYADGLQLQTRYNSKYQQGSVVSLHTAGDVLTAGEPVVLMDADVLYDHRLIKRLLASEHENCFLLDREFEAGEEPVKLCVSNGYLIDFRKRIDKNLEFDLQGESVGFFRLAPAMAETITSACSRYLADGREEEPYEEVLRDRLLAAPHAFGYEDITGIPWIEIDFPGDVQSAQQDILPNITLPTR